MQRKRKREREKHNSKSNHRRSDKEMWIAHFNELNSVRQKRKTYSPTHKFFLSPFILFKIWHWSYVYITFDWYWLWWMGGRGHRKWNVEKYINCQLNIDFIRSLKKTTRHAHTKRESDRNSIEGTSDLLSLFIRLNARSKLRCQKCLVLRVSKSIC